jgi:probable addiction module antidote protein
MTDKQRFSSVWDAIEDTPRQAASMRAWSELRMNLTASLTDPAEAAAYLNAVMELADHTALLLALALRQVAKAHGVAEVSRRADVGDKTLFKALSENDNPTLDTVNKVLHAMGLSVMPALPT